MSTAVPLLLMLLIGAFAGLGLLAGSMIAPLLEWRRFELCLFGMGATGALAGWLLRGRRVPASFFAAALLAGLVARIAFFGQLPSNDVARYGWEGRVQLDGRNPYAVAPADPSLAHLREPSFREINHPEWTAIYGPLAEALFAALAWAEAFPLGWKLLLLGCEGLALWLLWLLLRHAGRSPWWLLGWAWHPLAIWSVAGEGHLELLAVVPLLGALLALQGARPATAGLLLGCAALIKPSAALFAVLLVVPRVERRGLAVLLLALVAGHLPYASAGTGLFASLWRFGQLRFNSLPQLLLGGLLPAGLIRALSGALLAALIVALRRRGAGPVESARWLAAGWLLLSPTVHPWYGLPLVALLVLDGSWVWWLLTVSLIAAGETRALELVTGSWSEPSWLAPAVYAPFGLALAVELVRRERADRETGRTAGLG